MRLILTVHDLSVGGAEQNVVNYAMALVRLGHDVTVFAGPGPLDRTLERTAVRRSGRRVQLSRPWTIFAGALGLERSPDFRRADVVHSFMASTALVSALARRLSGSRTPALVVAPPGIADRSESRLITSARMRALATDADLVLSPSPAWTALLQSAGVPRDRIRDFEFNAVPLSTFRGVRPEPSIRAELGLRPTDRVICSVARLHPTKGQDLIVRAMPPIVAAVPEARLLLVGGGDWRADLERLAAQLGVVHAVRFAGERHDVPRVLATADVVVQATFGNGGPGLTVLEAFAAERPVVAFEFPDLRYTIGDSGAAMLVPHGDIPALAAGIARVLQDRALAAAIAASGARLAAEKFDLEVVVVALASLYAEARERVTA